MAPLNELHTFTRRHAPFHSGVTDLVVVQLLMPSIAILLVANRVYFRVKLAKVLAWDDYAIIAAILFWAVQIAYKSTLNICKMSILLLYRRIFATRKFQIAVNIVFVFVVLYFIASVAANLLECRPVAKNFDMSIPGKCINVTAHWLANAISTSSSDIVTLLLPMPVIHRLRLPPRQKYGLMCIFALGIFVCVISVIRMTTIPFGSQAHDRSKGTVNTLMWAMVEANTSIICACLPMLRTPLSMLFPTLFPPFHYGGETLSHQSSITAAEAAGISEDPEQMQEEQMLKSSKSLLKTTTIQVSISQKNEEGPRSPGEREMEKGACPLPSTEKQGGDDTPFDISAPRPMTPLLPLSSSPVTPLPSPPPYGSNTTSNVGE
ncbi:integral membrane protein [Histoplasma capsulatum G186AR]|uniref:Integral membrane protein n=1 Tax=Ajellomyces capsulatus (strain G186AR / H82 / ATCC MYA-2454 / RMSCC 2432) TaxID=447093 RepID=C0NWL4_AJECG|nr:uncharacterized protein HCBG_07544 [Histoplasma capsulatum G186AR]EEH04319.1 integral membrane protein [Histoplasma capsulatum G186AR]